MRRRAGSGNVGRAGGAAPSATKEMAMQQHGRDETETRGDLRADPTQVHRRQRGKNLAMLAVLVGIVVLLFVITIVKLKIY